MKKTYAVFCFFLASCFSSLLAQVVNIQVNALQGRKPISPYIYGKNNNVSNDPGSPTSAAEWKLMRDAGLHFTRENGGNNATKYNWRLKITSHPDWYNNVYATNWDYQAQKLKDSLPSAQGMWAFQLLGKAASNTTHNFDDWSYNMSQWWSGVQQNLAGGGTPNNGGGSVAQVQGNPNLYLENWTPDSTTGILNHWFGTGGLNLDSTKIRYWSMDNEVDIWSGTHDDVLSAQPNAEAFMQLYFAVAKKARAKYPGIKLVGPVPASEWQWYAWDNNKITVGGQSYVWLEFFIKRISEEEAATGIRLLDVIDIHNYPNETNNSDIVQLHRIYFDTTYNYPGANGVKTTSPSGWDPSITKEYIFGRCNQWLNQYMGPNHGVRLSVSEFGITNNNANVTASCYGSTLGTFADNGVEFFSPWDWYPGMWETMHLFSRYGKNIRVQSGSSEELNVSAYSSVNTPGDSMTVILVNRSLSAAKTASISLSNFPVPNGTYTYKRLYQLPSQETFVSHTNNALTTGTVLTAGNTFTASLPPLSITAVILANPMATGIKANSETSCQAKLYPNPVSGSGFYIELADQKWRDLRVTCYDALGHIVYSELHAGLNATVIEVPCKTMPQGVYTVQLSCGDQKIWTSRFVKL
ncbi:MAG: T9SS type A sorting domain-containing protein [Bacteroidetes bacterium]|nr:T9SS type A sorting domain-containing protein [Bacteroidota bacterium]